MLEPLPVIERTQADQPTSSIGNSYPDHSFEQKVETPPEPAKEKSTLGELNDDRRAERADAHRVHREKSAGYVSLSEAYEGLAPDEQIEAELEDEATVKLDEEDVETEDKADPDSDPEVDEQPEPKDEEGKPEPERAELPLPTTLAELANNPDALKAANERVTEIFDRSQKSNDPLMTEIFAHSLATVMQTPAEGLPQLKDTVSILQYGAQALIETQLPPMITTYFQDFVQNHLPQVLESLYPGMQASYSQAQAGNVWSDVCAAEEFKSLDLPAFGTPEFQAAAEELYAKNSWLNTFDPVGPDGKQLPVAQALRAKAEVCARLLAGARADPKAELKRLAAAVETGKKGAESRNRRVSAARSMGAGRTAGVIGAEERATTLFDAYNSNHSRGGI
jgi:hypothetical protein